MQSVSNQTLPGVLAATARRLGDRIAIEDGSRSLTYHELQQTVANAAAAFVASEVRPGDRVGIWGPNGIEWIVAALGAQSVGACIVPLNTRLKGREAGDILQRSRTKMLIHSGRFLQLDFAQMLASESLPDLAHTLEMASLEWTEWLDHPRMDHRREAARRLQALRPEDLADVMFTSGTTGKPKGVMSSHGQNVQVFSAWSSIVGLDESDRYLIVNPFFHAFGYKAGWLACLITGATILPMSIFDAGEIVRRISADRISVLPGPPTLFHSILAQPDLTREATSSLRLAVTGAANVPTALIERMHEDLGFKTVITGYGLTESTGTVSMCRPGDDPETIARSCGAPLPGVEVKVVDAVGQEVPTGSEGEIWVRGYNVMQGYLDDPIATAEAIDQDGWLHTGDIGTQDSRGYLRITDRKKDMFIVGGFNCYPAEIESLISSHPAVAQVAVVGAPDERMGEVAVAYIVKRHNTEFIVDDFIAWCRDNMANYKVPRKVHLVTNLPTTASGKVQKFTLRDNRPDSTESAT